MKSVLAFSLDNIKLGDDTAKTLGGTYGTNGVGTLVSLVLRYSLTLAGIILLGLLIFGGLTFIINAGSGDSKKAQQGKAAVTNALIGFAIVLFAYSIIKIIDAITGLSILNSSL
jgi:ABC-type Na+ efflux pump permease subunit